jgi:hypothetical protein
VREVWILADRRSGKSRVAALDRFTSRLSPHGAADTGRIYVASYTPTWGGFLYLALVPQRDARRDKNSRSTAISPS